MGEITQYSYFPGCTLKTKARDLDRYARSCAAKLGAELVEPEMWQCCGGVYPLGSDEIGNKLSSVRALNDAKEHGLELVTVCSMFRIFRRVRTITHSSTNLTRERRGFCITWSFFATGSVLTR